jgi:uncharacterized secreted protein with C-terminal beta-propeller domain
MPRTATLSAVQLAALVAVALVAGGVGAVMLEDVATPDDQAPNATAPTEDGPAVSTFDSAAAFRTYLSDADQARGFTAGAATARAGGDGAADDDVEVEDGADADQAATAAPQDTPVETAVGAGGNGNDAGPDAQRASDTNVQVEGIDEPDILKTTPQTAYYAPPNGPRVVHDDDRRDGTVDEGVRLVNVSDPAAPEVASRLEVSGRLLLSGDSLVVFQGDRILGYDVSDRAEPERVWEKELSDRVVTARLHDGTVYLVTESHVDRREPCPVEPMEDVTVPCTEIHHPTEPTPVDTTYTVTLFDPADGSVHDTASFVGAGGRSVVYVSTDRVYVTYPQQVDRAQMMAQFLLENQSDRLDQQARDRIREVQGYDLSPRATRIEIQRAIEAWLARLDETEREAAEQNLQDDLRAWAADNKRQFERTGIVAFDISESGDAPTVEAGATGSVPGHPLNQFSLDEHDGEFRIATTVSGAMGTDSANDLYVLDTESLDRTGAVQGMGITERIYSVRYVGDEAYVVTFRRIDPFHVVDLSDPSDPTVEGELKLPGFSSYLHPLGGDRVLGIGEQDGKVKAVIFDVSDPENPTIQDDTILDARWSAVADSHHAFLMDRRHGVFFLPAGDRALVYNYTDGLEVETTVATEGRVHRTAYVGDYLYVFGDNSITVVDERDWDRADEVELTGG